MEAGGNGKVKTGEAVMATTCEAWSSSDEGPNYGNDVTESTILCTGMSVQILQAEVPRRVKREKA